VFVYKGITHVKLRKTDEQEGPDDERHQDA
jgi:hypothetical protein